MNYKIFVSTIATIIITSLGLITTMAQDNPEIRQSFHVCEWGLLVIQHDDSTQLFDITINSPQNYTGVDGTAFTVSGTGKGLFEANLVVEVTDMDGTILFTEPTLVDTDRVGGEGDWSMDIDLSTIEDTMPIIVRAYSTSPEDGSVIAQDSIQLNLNSAFGLPFVDITRPIGNQGVSTSPLLVQGTAGAIFENNLNIQILDEFGGTVIAETFATVETDELAGQGTWSTEIDLELEAGETFVVYAFQPPVADGETITVDDTQFGVASPLSLSYDKILVLQAGDPITFTDDLCSETQAEFDNEDTSPILIDDIRVIATRSMKPLVNVTINGRKPSVCDMPMRLRVENNNNTIAVDLYYSTTEGMTMCTRDLQPFTMSFSLGTLQNNTFSLTVNDVELE